MSRIFDSLGHAFRYKNKTVRDWRVQVEFDADGAIWLGGNAVTCVDGLITA